MIKAPAPWLTCPQCAGIGHIRPNGEKKQCPTCKGERWVQQAPKPKPPADPVPAGVQRL